MTIKHKIIVGVDDIKAVIVECKCGVRVSLPLDNVRGCNIPERCPRPDCPVVWREKPIGSVKESEREDWASANINLSRQWGR
jgi:hypothetical protein